MRIKDGFTLRSICGEHVVIGEGLTQVNFNKMLSLNETAAWLWEELQGKDFEADFVVGLLQSKYDVTSEQALGDVNKLLEQWKELGVVE